MEYIIKIVFTLTKYDFTISLFFPPFNQVGPIAAVFRRHYKSFKQFFLKQVRSITAVFKRSYRFGLVWFFFFFFLKVSAAAIGLGSYRSGFLASLDFLQAPPLEGGYI